MCCSFFPPRNPDYLLYNLTSRSLIIVFGHPKVLAGYLTTWLGRNGILTFKLDGLLELTRAQSVNFQQGLHRGHFRSLMLAWLIHSKPVFWMRVLDLFVYVSKYNPYFWHKMKGQLITMSKNNSGTIMPIINWKLCHLLHRREFYTVTVYEDADRERSSRSQKAKAQNSNSFWRKVSGQTRKRQLFYFISDFHVPSPILQHILNTCFISHLCSCYSVVCLF